MQSQTYNFMHSLQTRSNFALLKNYRLKICARLYYFSGLIFDNSKNNTLLILHSSLNFKKTYRKTQVMQILTTVRLFGLIFLLNIGYR